MSSIAWQSALNRPRSRRASGMADALRWVHLGVGADRHQVQVDPVAAFRLVEVRPTDDVLEDPAVLFDGSDRSEIVVVAGHHDATSVTTLFPRDLQRQAKNRSGMALPSKLGHHDIADVAAYALERLVE